MKGFSAFSSWVGLATGFATGCTSPVPAAVGTAGCTSRLVVPARGGGSAPVPIGFPVWEQKRSDVTIGFVTSNDVPLFHKKIIMKLPR